MTKEQAFELVSYLVNAYPMANVRTETVEVYVETLEQQDYDKCRRAVRTLVTRSRFFPTLAEIYDEVLPPYLR